MKNFTFISTFIFALLISTQAFASWAFFVIPNPLNLLTSESGEVGVFATNNFTTTETLVINTGNNFGFSAPAFGTNVTGPGGINGEVAPVNNNQVVSPGETVLLTNITFTDTVGGTLDNPSSDEFDITFNFNSESAQPFNLFGTTIAVTAVPEPATVATAGLVIGSCLFRRRRRK